MKFLCLHGIGTNNQVGTAIFKMQTELEHLSSASSHHYAYYDLTSEASFISALDNLESYIETEGPFDGVMAFSQGAGLVAMLLVRRQYLRPEDPALFRCAILFSPVHVYDPVAYLERGEVQVLESMAPGIKLTPIPMVIVYGNEDDRKKECQAALAICDPDLLSVFVHDGGHEIPGLGAKNGLSDTDRQSNHQPPTLIHHPTSPHQLATPVLHIHHVDLLITTRHPPDDNAVHHIGGQSDGPRDAARGEIQGLAHDAARRHHRQKRSDVRDGHEGETTLFFSGTSPR
ncbi:hypothetical protein NPX13_g1547 [Xylaria arbuscula]|uniref:Serine hydrolase domain-containing protein n=1 Tax=Xylaria arbuscula TaxID=114810 RepID=A0A9W8NM61_9PEZI|nr:hypothetical protein NPX13_g1547 [Xylaria arbuscula]